MLKGIEAEEPRSKHGATEQSSPVPPHSKGKDTLAVETSSPKSLQKQKDATSDTRFQKQYDIKEEQVVLIYKSLLKGKKFKLPEVKQPEDAIKTGDHNLCLYHKMVHHPTKACYILKG